MSEALKNFNTPPFNTRMRDMMHSAVTKNDIPHMLESAVDFYEEAGMHLAENYMQGNPHLREFEDAHKLGDDELAERVVNEFQELTPDTVKAYVVLEMTTLLMDAAQSVLDDPENLNPRKHELWDFMTGLYDAARHSLPAIQDTWLREEVNTQLDNVRDLIATKLQGMKESIH